MGKFEPERPTLANAEQLEAIEATARERIAGWWECAGLELSLPCDTATVVALLTAVEYRVDGDTILGLLTDAAFPLRIASADVSCGRLTTL